MKKIFLLLLIALTLLGCKKDSKQTPENEGLKIEGKTYQTVEIGTQIWTSENYQGEGGTNSIDDFYTINGQKVYSRKEASSIILPEGWRVPSHADVEKLLRYLEEKEEWYQDYELNITNETAVKLLAKDKWLPAKTNNQSGFNVVPLYIDDGYANEIITVSAFWCSSKGVFFFSMLKDEPEVGGAIITRDEFQKVAAIRFVKNK